MMEEINCAQFYCAVCIGIGRWHHDGPICTGERCPRDHIKCVYCGGTGLMSGVYKKKEVNG